MADTHLRSLAKATSWRALGSVSTVAIAWLITGRLDVSLTIGAVEVVSKIALFWVFERFWLWVKWGRV